MNHTATIPTCPTCKTREVTFDLEGGRLSVYSECYECSSLRVNAPRCVADECLTGGHTAERAELVLETLGLVAPQYRCPRCDFVGNAVEWAARTGYLTGCRDYFSADGWLTDTRRRVQLATLVNAFTPARGWLDHRPAATSVAFARAYLDATD